MLKDYRTIAVSIWNYNQNWRWNGKQQGHRFYLYKHKFNGCGMGPQLVLVSSCFRENIVVTCKVGSFLCSLDNLLLKNVIVFFLKIKFQNGAHLKNGLFLTYFSNFLVTREMLQNYLQHTSHSHTYTYFVHPIDFFALPILKKYGFIRYGFSLVWFLVLILIRVISRHFGTINE